MMSAPNDISFVAIKHQSTITRFGDSCDKIGIKTHDSESRGQEEAGRMRRTSELYTRSTALKFVNALNKPP